jgi:hypothetical protein
MMKFNLKALTLFLVLISTFGIAATTTDTLDINANVLPIMTIEIAPGDPDFDITPETAITDQNLGTITINSNIAAGYDVTLTAANTSGLENGSENIAYTVKYNGDSAITLSQSASNVENVATQTTGAESRSLTLSITGAESKGRSAVIFTDTITIDIITK